MRALWLDFHNPAPSPRWPSLALLLAGIAAVSLTINLYLTTQDTLEASEFHIARKKQALERRAIAPTSKTSSSEHLPSLTNWIGNRAPSNWERLFETLEGAMDESVTFLSLEAREEELNLTVEAKNFAAGIGLIRRLQETKRFADVRLISHETVKDNPQHPVRFTLSVTRAKTS